MNGLIIDGKAYEAKPEISPVSCAGCDLKNDDIGCPYADACYEWHCIFRYSQSLTDKLNRE